LPFVWLVTRSSNDAVFLLTRHDFASRSVT